MENLPLVSIICTSYNHETYIKDALEGFVMQKTNFSFEIIVHDDASTDNTASIVKSYEIKYPDLFANIYQTENQYSKGNNDVGRIVFSAARGKYIALCEGDDYWIDPYKLQKQVNFLEANQDYALVYTKALMFNVKKNKFSRKKIGKSLKPNELLISSPIATLTTVFRKDQIDNYINEVRSENKNWQMGDYPMWLWFYFNSKIYFLPEITAIYRVLDNSASRSLNKETRYEYNLNSFQIANYFALKYLPNQKLYNHFSEKKYLFLFLYCIKNDINKEAEWLNKLKEIKSISFKTHILIFVFYNLKISNLYHFIYHQQIELTK